MNQESFMSGYMHKEAEWPEGSESLQNFLSSVKTDPKAGAAEFDRLMIKPKITVSRKGLVPDPTWQQKLTQQYIKNPTALLNMLSWRSNTKTNPYNRFKPVKRRSFDDLYKLTVAPMLAHIKKNPKYLEQIRKQFYKQPAKPAVAATTKGGQ